MSLLGKFKAILPARPRCCRPDEGRRGLFTLGDGCLHVSPGMGGSESSSALRGHLRFQARLPKLCLQYKEHSQSCDVRPYGGECDSQVSQLFSKYQVRAAQYSISSGELGVPWARAILGELPVSVTMPRQGPLSFIFSVSVFHSYNSFDSQHWVLTA